MFTLPGEKENNKNDINTSRNWFQSISDPMVLCRDGKDLKNGYKSDVKLNEEFEFDNYIRIAFSDWNMSMIGLINKVTDMRIPTYSLGSTYRTRSKKIDNEKFGLVHDLEDDWTDSMQLDLNLSDDLLM